MCIRDSPGALRALRLGALSRQGALRGAHEDLHEHLPERHDLPGQDLLPLSLIHI